MGPLVFDAPGLPGQLGVGVGGERNMLGGEVTCGSADLQRGVGRGGFEVKPG